MTLSQPRITSADLLPLTILPPRAFETPRLRLRALSADDSKLIFDLYASDPEVSRYMSFKCTGRLEDTVAFVEPAARYFNGEASPVRHFVWIVESKKDSVPIGSVGIGPKEKFSLAGGYILNKRFWGQGYASEAWGVVVDWAKTQSGVFRIEANHALGNPASGQVMIRAGMEYEGILKRSALFPNISDEPQDAVMYAWTRS